MQGPIWGEADTSNLQRLDSAGIGTALAGKLVTYNPSGWADAGVHEEYHEDGVWRGILYGRGPMVFAGRWRIGGNRFCTTAESGVLQIGDEICRDVWRDPRTGEMLMEHVQGIGQGLMRLTVRSN